MDDVEKIIGKQIDQFKVESFIARGAMGMVFKAFDSTLARVVALKLIPKDPGNATDSEAISRKEAQKRLLHEAQAAGNLDHPNIVIIHSYGETDEFQYICMEYVKGKTLGRILNEQGPIPAAEAAPIIEQVLLALETADRAKVVHRDIKPSNIMITEDGRLKVMDFGIAKFSSLSLTVTGMVLGTPYYMSPEQICGKKVDIRSDIFSLGAVFYEMLTGEKPFEAENTATLVYKIVQSDPVPVDTLNANIPQAVAAVISKAMAKDPDQRYQQPSEMLNDLRALASAVHPKSEAMSAPQFDFDRTVLASQHESSASGGVPEERQYPPAVQKEEMPRQRIEDPVKSPLDERKRSKVAAIALLLTVLVCVCGTAFWYFKRIPAHDSKPAVTKQDTVVTQVNPESSSPAGHGFVRPPVSQPDAGTNQPRQATPETLLAEAEKQFASNPDGAQKLLEEALALNPNSFDCTLSLARLLVSKRDYRTAVYRYKQALTLNSSIPEVYCELGNTYMRLADFDMAIDAFQAGLALQPRNKDDVLANIGTCYVGKGNADKAQLFFKQALEVNPDNAGAKSYMASVKAKTPSPSPAPSPSLNTPPADDSHFKSPQLGRQILPQKTVSPMNAIPGNAETIVGNYTLEGINPDGSRYIGTVVITQSGNKYHVMWKIAEQNYTGTGALSGQILTVNRNGSGVMKGVVAYGVGARGLLNGTYGGGKGKETLKRVN
jgi:serine/threonine-protein kinase